MFALIHPAILLPSCCRHGKIGAVNQSHSPILGQQDGISLRAPANSFNLLPAQKEKGNNHLKSSTYNSFLSCYPVCVNNNLITGSYEQDSNRIEIGQQDGGVI